MRVARDWPRSSPKTLVAFSLSHSPSQFWLARWYMYTGGIATSTISGRALRNQRIQNSVPSPANRNSSAPVDLHRTVVGSRTHNSPPRGNPHSFLTEPVTHNHTP